MADAKKFGGYSVTEVRYHRGHEGMSGVNGVLLRDGKRVASFYDDARGGMWEVQFLDEAGKRVYRDSEEQRRLVAFVKGLPPEKSEVSDQPLPVSVDMFLERLCQEYDATEGLEKKLRRKCATQTLFLLAGEEPGPEARYRVIKRPFSPEVKAYLQQKYPGGFTVLNERFPQTAAQQNLAASGVRVGDTVEYGEGRKKIRGTVRRINPKTLTVEAEDGTEWRCPIGGKIVKVERGGGAPAAKPARARAGRVVTREAVEALQGSWVGPGERVGISEGMEIEHLALKDEGGEDMTMGPLVAVRAGTGERVPVVLDKTGRARWFLASEAKKVANLLGAKLSLE
jgi:hypothetical protein